MSDTSWKAWERFVCRLFGGQRENDPERGEECRKTGAFYPEAKYRKRIPDWMEEMIIQAESMAREDQLPLVALTERRRDRMQALVICRLQDFYDWYVGGPNELPEEDNGPQADIESIGPN